MSSRGYFVQEDRAVYSRDRPRTGVCSSPLLVRKTDNIRWGISMFWKIQDAEVHGLEYIPVKEVLASESLKFSFILYFGGRF